MLKRLFHKKSFVILFVLCLLVCACAVWAGVSDSASPLRTGVNAVVQPIQKGFADFGDWIAGLGGSTARYQALEEENESLRQQLADLQSDLRDAQALESENASLREQLGMQQRNKDYTLTSAEIIASSTGNWGITYTLDCGTEDGVSIGNCVIVAEGMVGYITDAGYGWAEMKTVIDEDMRAGAIITESRDVGVANGDYALLKSGCLRLTYLSPNCSASVGDSVETSGLGGLYPPGVLIGTILSLDLAEDGLSMSAIVQPAADLTQLGRVFVITDFTVTE